MKPSEKHQTIRNLMDTIIGQPTHAKISVNICVCCGGDATEFKNQLSRKEFSINGLCQTCQDEVFDSDDDYDDDQHDLAQDVLHDYKERG